MQGALSPPDGEGLSSFSNVENPLLSPHWSSPIGGPENRAIFKEEPDTASESISILYVSDASKFKLFKAQDTVTRGDPEVKPERAGKAVELWQRNVEAYDRAVSARGEKADLQAALAYGFEQVRQIYAARWFMRPSTKMNKQNILVALRAALDQQYPLRLSERTLDLSQQSQEFRNAYDTFGGSVFPIQRHDYDGQGRHTVISNRSDGSSALIATFDQVTKGITILTAQRRPGSDPLHLSDMMHEHYCYARNQGLAMPPMEHITFESVEEPGTKLAMQACGKGIFPAGSEPFRLLSQTVLGTSVHYFQRDYPNLLAGEKLASITVSEQNVLTFAFPGDSSPAQEEIRSRLAKAPLSVDDLSFAGAGPPVEGTCSNQRLQDTSESQIRLRNTLYGYASNYIARGGGELPARRPNLNQDLLKQAGDLWIEILGERMTDSHLTPEETRWVNRIQSSPEETGEVVKEILDVTYGWVAQRYGERYPRRHNARDNAMVHVAALFRRADSLVAGTPVLGEGERVMAQLSELPIHVVADSPEPIDSDDQ